jgi:hypothetical protein
VTKIGTGAEKLNVPRLSHEVVSARLASGAVPKFRKKLKNVFDMEHEQKKMSPFQHGSKR